MKIILNGVQSNLRFSSAHIIPGHESCGYIHGHSYFVDVEIQGKRVGKFDFVVDFKDIKKYTREICSKLDHKLLIPIYNDLIEFEDYKVDDLFIEKLKNQKNVDFKIDKKRYSIPSVDCVFLPLPYTSAEELSKYFTDILAEKLIKNYVNIEFISVCVNEGIGQGAMFTREMDYEKY